MKVKRFLPLFLCLLILLFNFSYSIKRINKKEAIQKEGVILTLWNIDSFPGGKWSRTEFLLKSSIGFEKEEGILVSISSHSVSSANNLIKSGVYPDLISFGSGVNVQNFSVIEKEYDAGKINQKTYAIPFLRNKYYIIYKGELDINNIEKLTLPNLENSFPLISLISEDVYPKKIEFLDEDDIIKNFINGKNSAFLGTNKDIVRLTNKLVDYNVYPLNSFSDLFQYLSITTLKKEKLPYINRFIEYVTSKKVQEKLGKLALFSPYYNITFDEEILNKNQQQPTFSVAPFYSKEIIEKIKELSLLAIKGDKQAKIKLKENYYCKI